MAVSTTRCEDYEDQHRVFISPSQAELDCEGAEPTAVDQVLCEVMQSTIPSDFGFEEMKTDHSQDGIHVVIEGDLPEGYRPGAILDVEVSVVVFAV